MTTQDQNTQPTNSRVDIIQTVKTPLGFFTLTVLVVEAILGVAAGFSQGADRTLLIWGMMILIFLLIIIVVGLALFRPEALSGKRPGTITELPNRDDYLLAQINEAPKAQKTIWLRINTLSPSKDNPIIGELQDVLASAKKNERDVRILAPRGRERVEAASELSTKKQIPIRILSYLSAEDLRYMIIDQSTSIISISSQAQGSSTAGAIIKSEQLNRLLRDHFEQRWNHKDAMDYEAFLSFEAHELLNPEQPPSRKAISKSLGVDLREIDKALHIRPAKVIFLLGRPCSGKTSASRFITEYLQSESLGYEKSQISVYNDYHSLLTRFESDKAQKDFEPGPSKGFRVKNFDILDDCLRDLNKDAINDLNAKQFIIIEFSRKDYVSALLNFSPVILDSCTLFYLHAPLDICIKRNEGRKDKERTGEAGYVPPDILETYYKEDDIDRLFEKFTKGLVQIDNSKDGEDSLQQKIIVEVSKRLSSWLIKSGH